MALVDKKYVGHGSNSSDDFFSNEEKWVKVTYDFDADAGAQGDYDVLANESASIAYVVTDFFMYVETAVTSAGDPAIDLGIGDGGTEFKSDLAKGTALIGVVLGMDTAVPVKLPASGKIVLGIETADLTAGKVHMYFKLKQII